MKYKQLELRICLCSICWLFARARQSVLGGLVVVVALHRQKRMVPGGHVLVKVLYLQSDWSWVIGRGMQNSITGASAGKL